MLFLVGVVVFHRAATVFVAFALHLRLVITAPKSSNGKISLTLQPAQQRVRPFPSPGEPFCTSSCCASLAR